MKTQRFMKTLHHLLLLVLIGVLSISTAAMAAPGNDVTVTLDGEQVSFDQPPVIQDGRTLVPMRAIFEAMGASVDWDGATRTVTSVRDDVTIVLTIDSNAMVKNDQVIALEVPAQIQNGRTLVPLRAIADAFGADVHWDGATRSVTIVSDADTPEEPAEPFSALAYERYPGDENAPDWMVQYRLTEYYYHSHYSENMGEDYEGKLLADAVYVTRPSDMTVEQWETMKEYYADKEAPTCLYHESGTSMDDFDNWYYARSWPDTVHYWISLDGDEYSDDPTTNFVQDYMDQYMWVLYKNMVNGNPAGGNGINLVPNIPKALAYERYLGDENAPDWMVRHITEVDQYFYKEVYVTKPADMTSSEWETLKDYWRDKERPGVLPGGVFDNLTYPLYVYNTGSVNIDYVQTYLDGYIYRLYNYMVNDMNDGIANDMNGDKALRYTGDWITGDWRTTIWP